MDTAKDIIQTGTIYTCQNPTDSFELDFNKIKTVDDCVLIIKCLICGFNKGFEPKIFIDNNSILYDQLKHLAKDN